MNEEKIIDALEFVDDDLLLQVEVLRSSKGKRKSLRLKWVAAAAGFVLAIGCFALWQALPEPAVQYDGDSKPSSSEQTGTGENLFSSELENIEQKPSDSDFSYDGYQSFSSGESDITTNSATSNSHTFQSSATNGSNSTESNSYTFTGEIISWQKDGFTVRPVSDLQSASFDRLTVKFKENNRLTFVDKNGIVSKDVIPTQDSLPVGSQVQIGYREISKEVAENVALGKDNQLDTPDSDGLEDGADGDTANSPTEEGSATQQIQYVVYPTHIIFKK
ncbi:MAG: hypothetical protein IKD04_00780 [Clostridia bacterium]|nr:hypothetical protein [Clostridia bacterium]